MTIRRLTDPNETNPKKTIISLPRIINDIKQNIHLLTREHFIAGDGLPYDYKPGNQKFIFVVVVVWKDLPQVQWLLPKVNPFHRLLLFSEVFSLLHFF